MTGLGLDTHLSRTEGSESNDLLTDALGSTVALKDETGAVATDYTFEPFGKTASSGEASTNPFQFTGRENDGTGLYHYRARYYHPTFQRFISEDPIGFDGGDVNLYAYVGNGSLSYTDPLGLSLWDAVKSAAGAVSNAVKTTVRAASNAVKTTVRATIEAAKAAARVAVEVAQAAARAVSSAIVTAGRKIGCWLSELSPFNPAGSGALIGAGSAVVSAGSVAVAWGIWGKIGLVAGGLTAATGSGIMIVGGVGIYLGVRRIVEKC